MPTTAQSFEGLKPALHEQLKTDALPAGDHESEGHSKHNLAAAVGKKVPAGHGEHAAKPGWLL